MDFSEATLEAYLLQQLDANTQQNIASQLATDHELSEYLQAIHLALVNDYLRQQLPPTQRQAFEQLLATDPSTQQLYAQQQTISAALVHQQEQANEAEAEANFQRSLSDGLQRATLDWEHLPVEKTAKTITLDKVKPKPSTSTRWRRLFLVGLTAASALLLFFIYNPFQRQQDLFANLDQIATPASLPIPSYTQQEEQVNADESKQTIETKIRMAYLLEDYEQVVQLSEDLLETGAVKQKDYAWFALAMVDYQKRNYGETIRKLKDLRAPVNAEIYLPGKYYLGLAYLKNTPPDKTLAKKYLQQVHDMLAKYPGDHPDQMYKTSVRDILKQLDK